jgi:hypothetical protein
MLYTTIKISSFSLYMKHPACFSGRVIRTGTGVALTVLLTFSIFTYSTLAEEGELRGMPANPVVRVDQENAVTVSNTQESTSAQIKYEPSSLDTTVTISGPKTVEATWDEEMGRWVSEKIVIDWSVENQNLFYTNDKMVTFYESTDGGVSWDWWAGMHFVRGEENPYSATRDGLGCILYQARVEEQTLREDREVYSEMSNMIEVCIIDSSRDYEFSDVPGEPQKYTFYDHIVRLAEDDVVGGYGDGLFRPNYPLTRGQMAKFIKNANNVDTDTSCGDFPDVDENNTFYTEITSLKCADIISGYEDGTFRSDIRVSRGEAMKFVMEGLRSTKGDDTYLGYTGQEQPLSDVPPTYTFYEHIMAAYTNDIVSGYEDGTFLPSSLTTRGAMAKMIDNARNK